MSSSIVLTHILSISFSDIIHKHPYLIINFFIYDFIMIIVYSNKFGENAKLSISPEELEYDSSEFNNNKVRNHTF